METIELLIGQEQKDVLKKLCVESGESEENYISMAQILLNEAVQAAIS